MKATVGDVIQVDPTHDPMFGGCFGVVDEVGEWGCKLVAFDGPGMEGTAYYRLAHGKYEVIGRAVWIRGGDKS